MYGLQFRPPGATAAAGNCLLPPPAGELLKQNPGKIGHPDKIGRSIQADLKVVSAPARFWECGALLCGEVVRVGATGDELQRCSEEIR